MNTNRRHFLKSMAMAGGMSTLLSCKSSHPARSDVDYAILDRALERPVLKRELFKRPVIIESVELLRDRDSFICRVRSDDGAEGVGGSASSNMLHS
jgi:hypothetical protein